MRFTYRLIRDARGYLAECIEAEAAGEGKTARDALASLREALRERMFRADAIAPPPGCVETEIELVLTEDGQSEPSASV
jgi:hypothetical protein